MHTLAFSTDQAKTVGIVVIVGIVLVGLISALVVRWIVGKVIALVLAVVLAGVVYQQRASIQNSVRHCNTFFGVHLEPSNAQVRSFCGDSGANG